MSPLQPHDLNNAIDQLMKMIDGEPRVALAKSIIETYDELPEVSLKGQATKSIVEEARIKLVKGAIKNAEATPKAHVKVDDSKFIANPEPDDESLKILRNPELLEQIQKELDKFVEGERQAREVIFMVLNMRNVANLNKGSDNLMVNDESGTGKDYVVSAVFKLLPEGEAVKRERVSPKALAYLNDIKVTPAGWVKKALYLEDLPNAVLNDDSFKVFASADSNGTSEATIIINNQPRNISIRGKPSMVITIAAANPKAELLRRWPICPLTSSVEQTEAVLMKIAFLAEKGYTLQSEPAIPRALSFLKRVKVYIPFASLIVKVFPKRNVIVRTHFPRFLDYIKTSCALYQYQREVDCNGFYVAQEADYELARRMLAVTTSNDLMLPLTKTQKRVLERFANLEGPQTISDLATEMPEIGGERYLRYQLEALAKMGFLTRGNKQGEYSKPLATYSFNEVVKFELPSFNDLKFYSNHSYHSYHSINSNSSKRGYLNNLNYLNREQVLKVFNESQLEPTKDGLVKLLSQCGEAPKSCLLEVGFNPEQLESWQGEGLIYEPREGFIRLIEVFTL